MSDGHASDYDALTRCWRHLADDAGWISRVGVEGTSNDLADLPHA
jgi:hypothetical protein